MYWRFYFYNHRLRLIAYAVLAIVGALFTSLPAALVFDHGHWYLRHATNAAQASALWKQSAGVFVPALLVIFTFVASDLGASGIGEHASKRPLDFLLTRPRERRHFIISGWLAGIMEIAALMLLMLMVCAGVLTWLTGTVEASQLFLAGLVLLTLSAVIFGGSFMGAVVGGGSRSGFPLALAIVVSYLTVIMLRNTLRTTIVQGRFARSVDWLQSDQHAGSVLVIVIAMSFALLLVTQLLFEKKEIT